MEPVFIPDRLREVREQHNLNKAEAAKLLNLSKMGYLRYESAERTPSYQTIVFMAQKLGTSPDYLTGITDDPAPLELRISKTSDPVLFEMVKDVLAADSTVKDRILAYYRELTRERETSPAPQEENRRGRISLRPPAVLFISDSFC